MTRTPDIKSSGTGSGIPSYPDAPQLPTRSNEAGDDYETGPVLAEETRSAPRSITTRSTSEPAATVLSKPEIAARIGIVASDTFSLAQGPLSRTRQNHFRRIMLIALRYLEIRGFIAAEKPEGSTPSDGVIATALLRAYNTHYKDTPEAARQVIREHLDKSGGVLFVAFRNFVNANAQDLGLMGQKPIVKSPARAIQTSTYSAESAAHRILGAGAIADEIASISSSIPNDEKTAEAAREAAQIKSSMARLGRTEVELTSRLRRISDRNPAIAEMERLEELRNEAIKAYAIATVDFSTEAIEYYFEPAMARALAWMDKRASELPLPRAEMEKVFETALRNYIAIWLSRQTAGERRESLEISGRPYITARLMIEYPFESEEQKKATLGIMERILHHAAREDAFAHSISHGEVASLHDVDAAHEAIGSYRHIETLVGPEIAFELDRFYDDVREGKIATRENTEESARSFYTFMMHYLRRAANEHGEDFNAEHIIEFGIEPEIVRSIFLRVEDAQKKFGNDGLELALQFFSKVAPTARIPSRDELVPTLEEIRLSRAGSMAYGAREVNFIPYRVAPDPRERMTLREFISQIFGTENPNFRSDFKYSTGISWEAFLSWGEVREKPKSVPQIHWERISDNWEEIVAFAKKEGILSQDHPDTLPEYLRTYTPENTEQSEWLSRIDTAERNPEELGALAKTNKPAEIEDALWSAYTSWRVSVNRGEDVTTGPSVENPDILLIAYDHLNEHASSHGQSIDFMEYLAAIYPIVGRMLARAENGVVMLTEPEVLSGLFYEIWGYKIWAENVHTHGYESYTDVVSGTHEQHRRHNITPEFWDLRRYATKRFAKRLGIDREELYEIIGGYLRASYFILQRTAVFDPRGGRISRAETTGALSKYSIRFMTADARPGQALGTQSLRDRAVDTGIRLGTYDKKLAFLRSYLDAIQTALPDAKIQDANGNVIEIGSLYSKLASLERGHILNSSILGDMINAGRYSPEDIRRARDFYTYELDAFLSSVTGELSITGHMQLGNTSAPVQILYSASELAIPGHVSIAIGFISAKAAHKRWSQEEVADLIRLEAMASYAMITGSLDQRGVQSAEALESAVIATWPAERPLKSTIASYLNLPKDGYYTPKVITARYPRQEGSNTQALHASPLPPLSKIKELFARHAEELCLEDELASKALLVLEDYIKVIGRATGRFWPHTLEHLMEKRDAADNKPVRDSILSFFPKIGLQVTANFPLQDEGAGGTEEHLALRVFEDYRDLIPQPRNFKAALPIDEAMIYDLVLLNIENFESQDLPDPAMVFRLAIENIQEHNRDAHAAHSVSPDLPRDGLLGDEIRAAVGEFDFEEALHRAYFLLKPRIDSDTEISNTNIEEALIASGVEEKFIKSATETLSVVVNRHRAELLEMTTMLLDPKHGIDAYVRNGFAPPLPDTAALGLLARDYVFRRITGNLPIDPAASASNYANSIFVNYPDSIRDHIARTYQELVAKWFVSEALRLTDESETTYLRLLEISADSARPTQSREHLQERLVASSDGAENFDALLRTDRRLGIISRVLNREPTRSLEEAIREEYESSVIPKQQELDAELDRIVTTVTDVHARSLEIFTRINSVQIARDADEASLRSATSGFNRSFEVLAGIQASLETLADSDLRAAEIIQIRGNDHARPTFNLEQPSNLAIFGLLESSRRYLTDAENTLLEKLDRAEQQVAALESARTAEISSAALRLANEALGSLNEIVDELDSIHREATNELLPEMQTLLGSTIPASTESYDIFVSAVESASIVAKKSQPLLSRFDEASASHPAIMAKTQTALRDLHAAFEQPLHDDDDVSSSLIAAMQRLEEGQSKFADLIVRTQETMTSFNKVAMEILHAISEAENRLPIGDAVEMPKPRTLQVDVSLLPWAYIGTTSAKAQKELNKRALAAFEPFLNARIVSFSTGSTLISQHDAAAIERWKKEGRENALEIHSLFGGDLIIPKGELGTRITDPARMTEEHPLRTLVLNLRLLSKCKTAELLLFGNLANRNDTKTQQAFVDLLSYLSSSRINTINEATTIIRTWAAQNLPRLGIHTNETDSYTENYGPDTHKSWRKIHEFYVTHPYATRISIRPDGQAGANFGNASAVLTDKRIAEEALRRRDPTVPFFDPINWRWGKIPREMVVSNGDTQSAFIESIFRSSPDSMRVLLSFWTIYASRHLMELGRLNLSREMSGVFNVFIDKLLAPIFFELFDSTKSITLEEAQRVALEAYQIASGVGRNITPDSVTKRVISGWLDALPSGIKIQSDDRNVNQTSLGMLMRNPSALKDLQKLYLLHHYSEVSNIEATSVMAFVSTGAVNNWRTVAAEPAEIDREFTKRSAEISRNIFRPLFIRTRSALAQLSPETDMMGSAQLWAILSQMEPAMGGTFPTSWPLEEISRLIQASPAWMRILIQRLPHLAQPLAIIALTYTGLPDQFKTELHQITQTCFEDSALVDQTKIDALTIKIAELYRSQAQAGVEGSDAIITGLRTELAPNMTIARWLTGIERPWENRPQSFEGTAPDVKLRLLAPEFFKMRPEVVEVLAQNMLNLHEQPNHSAVVDHIFEFLDNNSGFSQAMYLLLSLAAKIPENINKRIQQFFTTSETKTAAQFVNMITEPEILGALRSAMTIPFDNNPIITTAMELTGEYAPHLPTEILRPADRMRILVPELAELSEHDTQRFFEAAALHRTQPESDPDMSEMLKTIHRWGQEDPSLEAMVGAFHLATGTMDSGQKSALGSYFENTTPTPETFVQSMVDLCLIPTMREAIIGVPGIVPAIFLPATISPPLSTMIPPMMPAMPTNFGMVGFGR